MACSATKVRAAALLTDTHTARERFKGEVNTDGDIV